MKSWWMLGLMFFFLLFSGCGYSQSETKEVNNKKKNQEMSHSNNPYYSRTDTAKLDVSKEEWKKILPKEVYHIAFEAGTEAPFTGKYWDTKGIGTYYCAVCGNKLFRSDEKFGSTCGWPSFFETARKEAVLYKPDHSLGRDRTEVLCARCHAHLGHVFEDGPKPTGLRYCMNSPSLDFVVDKKVATK